MYKHDERKTTKSIGPVAAALFAIGCSGGLSGTYSDEGNVTEYEFHRDGRATILVLGTSVAAEYQLDGDRVLVTSPQGTVVLRRVGNHLFGPMGLELTQRE